MTTREPCRGWNWKKCAFEPCKFTHVCCVCGSSEHRARDFHKEIPRKQRATSVQPPPSSSPSSLLDRVAEEKDRGSAMFRAGDFEGACRAYSSAKGLLPDGNGGGSERGRTLAAQLIVNSGMAQAALSQHSAAVNLFTRLLEPGRDSPKELVAKALFHRSKSLSSMGRLGEAEADLLRSIEVQQRSPPDVAITRELARIREVIAENERQFARRMMAPVETEAREAIDFFATEAAAH